MNLTEYGLPQRVICSGRTELRRPLSVLLSAPRQLTNNLGMFGSLHPVGSGTPTPFATAANSQRIP